MGTIRVEHSGNYTTISNQAIRDTRLSFKARGIHHVLLSYPNGWRVNIEHLASQSERDGRDSVASGLRELKEYGYLIKRPKQDEKGWLMGWEDTILEIPEAENQNRITGKPNNGKTVKRENRITEKPNNGKPVGIINNYEVTTSNEVITSKQISKGEKEKNKKPPATRTSSQPTREENPEPENRNGGTGTGKPERRNLMKSALEQTDFDLSQNPKAGLEPTTLALGQNLPPAESTAQKIKRIYQETGILPRTPMEIEAWVQEDLGSEIIALYRKSGRVTTTKTGDIDPDFAAYLTNEYNQRSRDKKDIDYGYNYIKSMEWGEKRNWETLSALVLKWQAAKQTGNRNINLSQSVEAETWKQESLNNLSAGTNDWI